jgi:hypothetical protein
MLILVSKTIFVSVYTPLVAIHFSASAQLVSSDLLPCHSGGGAEEAGEEREGARREREKTMCVSGKELDSEDEGPC